MPFRILDHTADAAVEATAPTLAALLAELAHAMSVLIAGDQPGDPTHDLPAFRVIAEDPEDAVIDVLTELLWRSEEERILPVTVSITPGPDGSFAVAARGVPFADTSLTGAPVKAVTYHDLEVRRRSGSWFARVVFDV